MARAQTQNDANADVTVAVLDVGESARVFGVPLARRGIQPVYLKIANRSDRALRLYLLAINPNYFTPLEAAAANHFSILQTAHDVRPAGPHLSAAVGSLDSVQAVRGLSSQSANG